MLGGSDAGAHLDRMCGAPYTTRFLADCLRGRELVALERAVQMITQAPAELFGLRDRGVIAEGAHADLVLLDPETVDMEDVSLVERPPGRHGAAVRRRDGRVPGVRERPRDRPRRRRHRRPAREGAPFGAGHADRGGARRRVTAATT